MPIACRLKMQHGLQFCGSDCPATAPQGVFRYFRIERPTDIPPPDEKAIDVAVLDMNHGWSNLGHDSLVHAILDCACDLLPVFESSGLHLRVLSYEVRRSRMLPEPPGERFSVYVGTGGPGDLDPRRNDGNWVGSQGIKEDPRWEEPLYRLFDAILADEKAALLAVCHSFGILCRWSRVALPTFRGADKGGKRSGILDNILTPEALAHPWFLRFSKDLPDGLRLRVVENRLFDLIPQNGHVKENGVTPIGYETRDIGGERGDAVTMLEFARDPGGVMPRIFGVNHHPEIVDRARQLMILEQKRERGEVTREWYDERAKILTTTYPDENSDRRLHLTADYTLLAPLRFHIQRAVRLRADALGLDDVEVHEDQTLPGAGAP